MIYRTFINTEHIKTVKAHKDIISNLFHNITQDEIILDTNYSDLIRTKTVVNDEETMWIPSAEQSYALATIDRIYDKYKDIDMHTYYKEFKIPKKTHGFRTINAPNDELKKDLKDIANILIKDFKALSHDCAWAYTSGRDVVGAMKEHVNNKSKWYLKIDLHDFFGSCNPDFIKQQLNKLYTFNFLGSDDIIDEIIKVATLNNGLPQGTPLSPLLTNLIMVEYDYKIIKEIYNATQNNLFKQKYIYTRYADDIIISAKNKFDYKIIVELLKELFKDTPLTINEEKTRFGSSAGRNWNLGIMCNKEDKITVGYKRKQELKAAVNNYMHSEEWELTDLRWLLGQFSWLHNVEPEYYTGINNYFEKKYEVNIVNKLIKDIKRKINN